MLPNCDYPWVQRRLETLHDMICDENSKSNFMGLLGSIDREITTAERAQDV